MSFFYRIASFLRKCYGFDFASLVFIAPAIVLAIINTFFHNTIIQLVVYLLILAAFLRAVSQNYPLRKEENRIVVDFFNKVKGFFSKFGNNEDKEHIYKKCPKCKARLRFKRIVGKHHAVCPRCKAEFDVNVWR